MKKNFLKIAAVLTMGALMTACLDDDQYALHPDGTQNVIEFLDPSVPSSPAGAIYPVYSNSFSLAPSVTIPLTISYSGANGNDQNIELSVAVDPAALQAYNDQMNNELNGSTFSLLPEANYELETTSVTIPAGSTKTTFNVTVFPEVFDFSKSYALPVRITSSSHGVLSAHFSVAILQIGVRNNYDGVYEILGGSITRNSATGPDLALGGNYVPGLTMDLATLNANTVGIEPLWKDGSGVGGVVGTQIRVTETPVQATVAGELRDGFAVVVTSGTNATLKNTPGATNAFFPLGGTNIDAPDNTQEFVVNFDWGAAPSTRIIADLRLKYRGPRP